MSDQQQDTEITLGVGKLVGLFFLLVVLCGVFLGLGYTLGKNAASPANGAAVKNEAVPAGTISSAVKPGAAQNPPKAQDQQQPAPSPDLTFYKAVEQKDASAELEKKKEDEPKPLPEMKGSSGGFVVQVAAVSKKEDAEALQQALQRKQYPVVVTPGSSDKLYHVQIGPFPTVADADAMKARLAADGYNAIVKK